MRDNTLDAFRDALAAGATALESDLWLTSDGVPVLDHDGVVGGRLRRRKLRAVDAASVPAWMPSLSGLYATCGTGFDLSLDVKDPAGAIAAIAVARSVGAVERLWLCGQVEGIRALRQQDADVKLVVSTSLRGSGAGARLAYAASEAGADAVNLRAPEWSLDLVDTMHARDVLAFAWDVQSETVLQGLLRAGIDGVYSDSVDLLRRVGA